MRDVHTHDPLALSADTSANTAPREHATSTEGSSSEATPVTHPAHLCPCGFRGGSLNRASEIGRLVKRYGRWFLVGRHMGAADGPVCAVGLPRAAGEPSALAKTAAEAIDLFIDAERARNARAWLLPGGL